MKYLTQSSLHGIGTVYLFIYLDIPSDTHRKTCTVLSYNFFIQCAMTLHAYTTIKRDQNF